MGTIPDITEFANSGDTTEPSSTKKDLGWLVGEKPPAEWLNWLMNRNDRRINQLIADASHARGSLPPSLTPYEMCMRNQVNAMNMWHYPWTDLNSTAIPSNASTATIGWDTVQERPILFVASHSGWATTYPATADIWAFPCWHYDQSMLTTRTLYDASPGFSTSGSSRCFVSLCAMGDYLYVLCRDASGIGIYVQKYSIANWTGVPVASVEINNGFSPTATNSQLIQLNDNYLGVVLDFGTGTIRCVAIDADDCSRYGYQDISSSVNTYCIASDGTYMYIATDGATNAKVIRIDVPSFTATASIDIGA